MNDRDVLADEFERCRPQLRAVAYRMLGSLTEADDAIQECWFRLDRKRERDRRPASVAHDGRRAHLPGHASRTTRPPGRDRRRVAAGADRHRRTGSDPESDAMMADSVGLALLVVLDTLGPAERVSFVLHDVFGMSFDEIAQVLGKTPAASRQLASRARRRVRDAPWPRRRIQRNSGGSSTRSWPPPSRANSRRCSPSSIPMSSSDRTVDRRVPASPRRCRAPVRWPSVSCHGRPSRGSRIRFWSSAPPASWSGTRRHRWRSSGSRSREARS